MPAASAPSIGVQLWEREPRGLAAKAARVEALGFASVTVGDHLHRRTLGPLTACAIVAGATERVRVGPLVLNNDLRHPVVLAHEAATLARASGGRFELGLGAGFARREYRAAGLSFDPLAVRAARLAESARILRGLLAGERVDLDGEHFTVHADPTDPPHPPVPLVIGGNSPEVHAVAASHADVLGLTGLGSGHADFSSAGLERQLAALDARVELHVLVQWHDVTEQRAEAAERAAGALGVPLEVALDSPYVLIGSAREIAERLREHRARFGIARWTIFGDRPDLQPAEALVPVLELLGAQ